VKNEIWQRITRGELHAANLHSATWVLTWRMSET